MKAILLIVVSSLILCPLMGTNSNDGDGVFIAPDYLASFYDYYTLNWLNTRSLGMGNSTVGVVGGIQNALLNPASLRARGLKVYVEAHIKDNVREKNHYIKEEEQLDGSLKRIKLPDERNYLDSNIPAIHLGLSYSPRENISLGGSFSMPQMVRYNLFGRFLKTGAYYDRYPTMINYQTMLTFNKHFYSLNLGLNAIMNYYSFSDVRVENTYDRVSFGEALFSFQPGILYQHHNFSIGATYKLPAERTFEVGNIPAKIYHKYEDVTLPGQLELGAAMRFQNYLFSGAVNYEQTSDQYEEFDDRVTVKMGADIDMEQFYVRAGFIYFPQVYSGRHDVISGERLTGADNPFEFDVQYDYLEVVESDMLLLTAGFTYPLPQGVDFSMGAAADISGNVGLFQLSVSFDIKIEQIIRESRRP